MGVRELQTSILILQQTVNIHLFTELLAISIVSSLNRSVYTVCYVQSLLLTKAFEHQSLAV